MLPGSEAPSCPSQRLLSSGPCSSRPLSATLTAAGLACPAKGDAGAQEQQGPGIPHEPQREIHKSKGPGRTKLSHEPITEPDLKRTLGQRPASCESPPGPLAMGKTTSVASWLLLARLGGTGVCGSVESATVVTPQGQEGGEETALAVIPLLLTEPEGGLAPSVPSTCFQPL